STHHDPRSRERRPSDRPFASRDVRRTREIRRPWRLRRRRPLRPRQSRARPVARWQTCDQFLLASVSARRSASATIVSVGLAEPPLGNTDEPATKKLSYPCTRQSESTT